MTKIFDVLPAEAGEAKVKTYPHPERTYYYKVDISDVDQVQAACTEALKVVPKGSLAGGVHCAAVATSRKWSNKMVDSIKASCVSRHFQLEADILQDFKKTMDINSTGTFIIDACVADAINSQYPDEGDFPPRTTEERGIIINIASVVGWPVPARCLTYGVSKSTHRFRIARQAKLTYLAAVLGITSGAADFLGPSGIRVCSVSPAVVASALMGPDRIPYFESELEAGVIFPRRTSQPAEVAHAILYLIENAMMNDFHMKVDGGWRGSSNWGGAKDRE
jgi:3-hydroxyacyl-CoA dehydrogenase